MIEKPEKEIKKLIKRAKNGESEAFGQIYDCYINRVYRFLLLKVSNREEAEDMSQQVFMKAWEALPRFENEGVPFVSWLFRIARNLAIDFYRTKKNVVSLNEEIGNEVLEDSPEDIFFNVQKKELVMNAIEDLTEEQKEVVVLRFVEGFSYSEMSKITQKNQAALRILQHRAVKKLKKFLENEEDK
jgi:RNA polymerase sigma-70 factor (ECF subfamily)